MDMVKVEQSLIRQRQTPQGLHPNGRHPPASFSRAQRTLFGGKGGFGHLMVQMFRYLMQDEPGGEYIRYQEIDVSGEAAAEYESGEFIFLGKVRPYSVLARLKKDPQAYANLVARIGDLYRLYQAFRSSDNLADGARRYRPAGLMGLVVSLEQRGPQIEAQMMQPVYQLFQYQPQGCGHSRERMNHISMSVPLAVREAASLPGGSGSSIYLDLAYLRLHQLRQKGIRPVETDVVLALPGVYWMIEDQTFILANTYAALLELMRAYRPPLPPLSLGSFGTVLRDFPPFVLAYLVDGSNDLNYQFGGPEATARLGAEFWRMTTTGKLAQAYTMTVKNILPQLGYPYIASSFGVAGWRLPVNELITQFGYRSGAAVIVDYLLAPLTTEAQELTTEQLHTFVHHAGLGHLSEAFAKDEAGEEINVSLQPFKHYPRRSLPSALAHYGQEQQTRLEKTVPRLAAATTQRLTEAIDRQVEILLNAQTGGVQQARAFLGVEEGQAVGGLAQYLEQRRQDLNRRLDQTQTEREQLHMQAIKRARIPFYRRLTPQPRQWYLRHKQAELEAELTLHKLGGELAVVDEVLRHVYDQARQIDGWQLGLGKLADVLLDRERLYVQQRVAHQAPTITNVLCPDEEEQLYQRGTTNAVKLARQGLMFARNGHEFRLIYDIGGPEGSQILEILSEEGMARHLQFAKQFWLHLNDLSVETILTEQGKTPAPIAADLEQEATPQIALDQDTQERPVITQMLLGSEHGASGFFAGFTPKAGLSVVATGNRHRIDFLYTIHGVNPLALAQIEAMEHAYHTLRARGEHLHICPESELQDEQEAKDERSD